MDFREYSTKAIATATYPNRGCNMLYPSLGIAGESGEVVDKVKKLWRNKRITSGDSLNEIDQLALALEIGDVLWYINALTLEIGMTLEEIAKLNLEKLYDRTKRGVVNGEGDNR